jgi:hypothetical protein
MFATGILGSWLGALREAGGPDYTLLANVKLQLGLTALTVGAVVALADAQGA